MCAIMYRRCRGGAAHSRLRICIMEHEDRKERKIKRAREEANRERTRGRVERGTREGPIARVLYRRTMHLTREKRESECAIIGCIKRARPVMRIYVRFLSVGRGRGGEGGRGEARRDPGENADKFARELPRQCTRAQRYYARPGTILLPVTTCVRISLSETLYQLRRGYLRLKRHLLIYERVPRSRNFRLLRILWRICNQSSAQRVINDSSVF